MIKNIAQLEAYYWVARLESFHAAARRLRLTQPAISSRVKELEQSLGFPLFVRTTRSVTCTAQGRAMFDYVERILSLVQDLEGRARGHGGLKGLLRFGAPDSFGSLCLARFLQILESHADLNIEITLDNSRNLSQRMSSGMLDMAIIASPENVEHLNTIPLGTHAVAWVASPELGLHSRPVDPDDLTKRIIFTNPSPSNMFSMLMDWFGEYSLYPRRIHTCNSLSTIAGLVGAGAGIAILPTCMIEDDIQGERIVRVNVPKSVPPQEMLFAFSKGSRVKGTLEVLDAARAVARETRFLI